MSETESERKAETDPEALFDELRAFSCSEGAPLSARWAVAEILNLRHGLEKPQHGNAGVGGADGVRGDSDSDPGPGDARLVIDYYRFLNWLQARSMELLKMKNRVPKVSRKHHFLAGAASDVSQIADYVRRAYGPKSKG